jgi:hypothetical protein
VDPLRRSTLDLIGDGLTLFAGDEASVWRQAATSAVRQPPVSVVPLPRLPARSLGVSSDGALLVRPDGVPIAHWWTATDAVGRLRDAVTELLGGTSLESAGAGTAA